MMGLFFVLYAVPTAALVLYLMREKEGWKATVQSCALGMLLGVVLSVAFGSFMAGAFAVNFAGIIFTAIAMVITAIWINKGNKYRRPSNDLRG